MSKHAPAPWKWDGDPCNYDPEKEAPWLFDSNQSYPPILGGEIKCNSKANACLIESAPELLEALKSIAEYWNRDRNDEAMHNALWFIIETATEAIAKAEGV